MSCNFITIWWWYIYIDILLFYLTQRKKNICNSSYRGSHISLQLRHNEHDDVSNHQPHDCLLNRLFRRRSKETSKLCVTGLCAGNSPVTGEFSAQRASNAENVSIWWRHHVSNDECYIISSVDLQCPSVRITKTHERNFMKFLWLVWHGTCLGVILVSNGSKFLKGRQRRRLKKMFSNSFDQAQIKDNIKAPRHWPLWGECYGDRWIPLTNGQ